nr:aromatic compound degradation protein PaaI [Aeromicrobium sp.]
MTNTNQDALTREKTISWVDPHPQAAQAASMSGLDYLNAMIDGTIPPPPIASHINLEMIEATPGTAVMAATPDESHYNPIGSVHGGFFATLLDSVCGCAVQSTLPAGTAYTSLDLNVSFLRGITTGTGRVVATGRVTKPGSRAAFVEADIKDADGRLLATATSTCLVFPAG